MEINVEDYYRRYGHLQVDLGLFTDMRIIPPSLGESNLKDIYCNDIGFEFMHTHYEEQEWFIQLLENSDIQVDDYLLEAYEDIVRADQLEHYLSIQFVGQKRFSLEGCEALIPLMERVIKSHVEMGYNDVVIGMPHRVD